jgi:dihydroflavonol-4-reductase
MKKVLVTGAGGFIGSHIVEELLKENIEVKAFIRPEESLTNLKGMKIERVEGDVLDSRAVLKAMAGVDTVFHLAAIYSIWMRDWSRIYEVNMQGTQNVLWAAMKSNIARVVYTSSIASIGIAPGKQLSDEETPFNQYTLGNHYVLTKYLSQQIARGFAANGFDLVIVNPCFPFGTNDIMPTPPEVSYASQYLFFDNTKARNELGLTLTPIEEALRDSVRWFRENRYAP